MPRSVNQKLKLLYVRDYLERCSDEEHPVTTAQIIAHLQSNGISAERKSVYNDIAALQDYGVDIVKSEGKQQGYYIASREFEISELKLLADAVVSAKFLSESKAESIVKKLASFCSKYEAGALKRSVFVFDRVTSHNEKVFYNVDALHRAISEKKKLSFVYNEWRLDFSSTENVKLIPRRNGERYCASPSTMIWDDEKYYLIAYLDGELRNFRVDKMEDIVISEESCSVDELNVEDYRKKTFSMFNGREETVSLCFRNSLIGVITDRFGKRPMITKYDDEHFKVTLKANISPQFYAFLFAYGEGARILSPQWVISEYKEMANKVISEYK